MKKRLIGLFLALILITSSGCVVPVAAILSGMSVLGVGYNQYLSYDLKKKQLELEREKFELEKTVKK